MYTTLNKIKEHNPCRSGWRKLLSYLNKTTADDEPISLLTILDSNGFEDTLWCLRAVDGYEKEKRLLAVKYARRVQHLLTDPRSINSLDVAFRYANGEATKAELNGAYDAAWAALDTSNTYTTCAAVRAAISTTAACASSAAYSAARTSYDAAYSSALIAYDVTSTLTVDAASGTKKQELKYQRGEFIKMVNSVSSN